MGDRAESVVAANSGYIDRIKVPTGAGVCLHTLRRDRHYQWSKRFAGGTGGMSSLTFRTPLP